MSAVVTRIGAARFPRVPSEDELAGIVWWNALSRPERNYWLEQAGPEAQRSVAGAWAAYKRQLCQHCNQVPAAPHLTVCPSCFEGFTLARRTLYAWVRLGALR